MVHHFERTDLGEHHAMIMGEAKSTLREGEAIIAVIALETWKARLLSMFSDSAEEGSESQFNPYCYILQDLRMYVRERGALFFQ